MNLAFRRGDVGVWDNFLRAPLAKVKFFVMPSIVDTHIVKNVCTILRSLNYAVVFRLIAVLFVDCQCAVCHEQKG